MARTIWDYNDGYTDVKEYLVQFHYGECVHATMMTEREVIDRIDARDYTDELFDVYDVETEAGTVEKLEVYGAWHNPKDPLYIKVTRSDGTIVFDGYGTDH